VRFVTGGTVVLGLRVVLLVVLMVLMLGLDLAVVLVLLNSICGS